MVKINKLIQYIYKYKFEIICISVIIISLFMYHNYILNNIQNYKEYNLYNGGEWDEYRFGDIFGGWFYSNLNKDKYPYYLRDINKNYPNSFGSKYVQYSGYPKSFKKNDYDILEKIFNEYNYDKPDNNTLVVHLRLGDVLNTSKTDYINYYYSYDYYHKLLEKIKKNNNIKKVDIVTGLHYNTMLKESNDRLNIIRNIFEENYPVNIIITNNPDKDLYYMCHSKYFCRSGKEGGYTNIISNYVKRNKNNIVYEE